MSFNKSNALLNQRCRYLEDNMQFSAQIPDQPAEGMQYKHFVLQGLVHAAYNDGNDNRLQKGTADLSADTPMRSGSHTRGLFVFDYETSSADVAIPLAHLREHGLDPSTHAADEYLGSALRQSLADTLHKCFNAAYGAPTGGAENITQQYKGREITPNDPEASWAEQQISLLGSARSARLYSLLGQRHVVHGDGNSYGWSPRRAGFPVRQFQGNPLDAKHLLSPHLPKNPSSSYLQSSMRSTVVQSNPTIALVTVEVPIDFDSLVAGSSIEDVTVKIFCRHITTPHWMGYGQMVNQAYWAEGEAGKSSSYSRLYNTGMGNRQYAGIIGIYDPSEANDNEFGDYLLVTPTDAKSTSVADVLSRPLSSERYYTNASTRYYRNKAISRDSSTLELRVLLTSPKKVIGVKMMYDDRTPVDHRVTYIRVSATGVVFKASEDDLRSARYTNITNEPLGAWVDGEEATIMLDKATPITSFVRIIFYNQTGGTTTSLRNFELIYND